VASDSTIKRKLAAILSADVAGYSRLMSVDEEGTLVQLKQHREAVINPAVSQRGGRIVGTAGDGFLIEFPSAVDAVDCAVDMQKDLAKSNEEKEEDRRMEFRVGINLGDVMIEGDDLFGDGVNIAARIQALAESGGIYISGNVFDQVKNKITVAYEDLGEKMVKNMSEPVHVYRVRADVADPTVGLAEKQKEAEAIVPPRVPSIAVLPFENKRGDADQEQLADGISEGIISILARSPGIFVISRNSTFAYKGSSVRVQQLTKELGAHYVVEGSVQTSGNRVRISAQIVEAESGKHIWAERFDRTLEDVFALEDEISWAVSTALRAKVTEGEQARVWMAATSNPQAADHTLRAYVAFMKNTRNDNLQARELWQRATELDPTYAVPWMGMGWAHFRDASFGWSDDPVASFAKAAECAQKSIALDELLPDNYGLLGILSAFQRQFDEAVTLGEKATQLNPNHATVVGVLAWIYTFVGRAEEAVALAERSMQLSPFYQSWVLDVLGRAHVMLGHGEEAIATSRRAIAENSESYQSFVGLAIACGALGSEDDARAAGREVLVRNRAFTVQSWITASPYANDADLQRELDGLRRAGIPEN
jgi:adenylate cyclase